MSEIIRPIYVPTEAAEEDLFFGAGSLFLAGPTPRCKQVKSWRPEFLKVLKKRKVGCSVFIPELKRGGWLGNQEQQNNWEYRHLHAAAAIVFWIPRDLNNLPGFTTNVEFGYWVKSERCFYGRPDGAAKTNYLDWLYEKEGRGSPASSMDELAETVTKWLLG
jgi:hypothetical protein